MTGAPKILVAGIGNIFLGDDGFGPAVIENMLAQPERFRGTAEIVDFGIRGMDLAYALTGGIDAAVLIDATARGGEPGTLYVIEPTGGGVPEIQTHAMDPARVLAFAATIGELPRVVRVIGCEPARLDDDGDVVDGLSPQVAAAIEPAVTLVIDVVSKIAEARCTS